MATETGGGVEVSLATVLTESQRLISAHSRHFLALTLIFQLLPCFSLSFLPSLLLSSSPLQPPNSQAFLSFNRFNIGNDRATLGAALHVALFAVFLFSFFQLATASITRSVLHGFYGRPVRLFSAAAAAVSAFPRLLFTTVLALSLPLGFLLVSLSSLFLVLHLIGLLLGGAASSAYVMLPVTALALAVVILAVRLHLGLLLSPVVTVAESTWGFHPLKRSHFLVSGVQFPAALSVFLFFKLSAGVLLASAAGTAVFLSGEWVRVVLIVVACASLMAVFLYETAAVTVLYMYCKAARGELAGEIAEEFARDYVSLPFDGHKVPHVVSIVYNVA